MYFKFNIMIIEINDNSKIEAVCNAFMQRYPFLKIEFYNQPHGWQESTSYKHLLPHDKTIGEVRNKHNPGALEIHASQKTGIVEQEFNKRFGLNVQVFRRHGDAWVQTAGTDELTLEEQNETGKNATQDMMHGTNRKLDL